MRADIQEIFSSIQGEGLYVGVGQVFLRFRGCNLSCTYCDTPETGECRVEQTPGRQDFKIIHGQLEAGEALEAVSRLWRGSTRHLSLTGGEPLLYPEFIQELSCSEYPLYLETNSSLPWRAEKIKDVLAVAACDLKLPEHHASNNYSKLLEQEKKTLEIFHTQGVETFAKIIVTPDTTPATLTPAVEAIKEVSKDIPLILQPVSPRGLEAPRLLELLEHASGLLETVRIIPQTHRILGIL